MCLLAYYVEWHMRKAWALLLFDNEDWQEERKRRNSILPTKPSESAQQEKRTRKTADRFPVHGFETLMAELASRARIAYAARSDQTNPTCKQVPEPTPLQARAYDLLILLPVAGS